MALSALRTRSTASFEYALVTGSSLLRWWWDDIDESRLGRKEFSSDDLLQRDHDLMSWFGVGRSTIKSVSTIASKNVVLKKLLVRYKWDKNEKHLKPETGLLQLREGLKVSANLRPASVLPQVKGKSNAILGNAEKLIVITEMSNHFVSLKTVFGKTIEGLTVLSG